MGSPPKQKVADHDNPLPSVSTRLEQPENADHESPREARGPMTSTVHSNINDDDVSVSESQQVGHKQQPEGALTMRVLLGAVRSMATADRQAMWREMMRICQPESEPNSRMPNAAGGDAGHHQHHQPDNTRYSSSGGGDARHHRGNQSNNARNVSSGGGAAHPRSRNEPHTPGIRKPMSPTTDQPEESPQRSLPDLSSIGHESQADNSHRNRQSQLTVSKLSWRIPQTHQVSPRCNTSWAAPVQRRWVDGEHNWRSSMEKWKTTSCDIHTTNPS